MKKVCFDFDSTLDKPHIQDFAQSLIKKGFDVWICTTRHDDNSLVKFHWSKNSNDDLYKISDKLDIPRDNIKFMNGDDKWGFIQNMDFIFHLDDDWHEINHINSKTKTIGISCFGNKNWKQDCKNLL